MWRAIDRARQWTPDAIGERRHLRDGVRFLRDELDVLFYANRDAGWSARRWTDAVVALLFELDAVDLCGLADVASTPQRRRGFRRKLLQFQVRPPRAPSEK